MKLFFTLISLLPIFTFGQSINYTISGKFVKSEPDFKKLYIGRDSVTLNSDNTFSYSGMLETPGSVYLLADRNSSNEEIWVNGGNINISLEEYAKPGQITSYKFLKIDSVKGSKETEAYQYLHDSLIKLGDKYPKRNLLDVDSMKLGYFQLVKDYVEKNKNSYFSAMLTNYSAFTLDQKRDLLKIIKDNPASDYVEALETSIKQMELLKPGNKISDFTQPSTDGKPVSLYSLKSRFVLIQFWASWCAPCRWENPQLIKLYSKYHPDGNLDIVDISLDTESSDWREAIAKDHLPWINVCDFAGWQNLLVQKYILTPHVPFSILMDSSHSIVASDLWPSQVEEILQKKLGK